MSAPQPPRELRRAGRALWRDVQQRYELEEHERGLLLEMCRTLDALDRLATVVVREGDLVTDHLGNQRAHPALVEARQLRIAYARLAAALRLPAGEEGAQRRPQRRVGVRGVYGIRGVVAS